MKRKYILIVTTTLLVVSLLLTYGVLSSEKPKLNEKDFFVGIDVAYDNSEDIKTLINEVSNYTNVFLIGSTGITRNSTKLNEIVRQLNDTNLHFIIYEEAPLLNTVSSIQTEFGDKFLGLQYEDEAGGGQLDLASWRPVVEAANYSDAATQWINMMQMYLNWQPRPSQPAPTDFRLFTVDYALYWYDYKAGYDIVLAELGWNYSRQLNIALCRGAATVLDKEWGVIVTWTYDHPPYIESGDQLYQDLILAYENGAKYVLVFDSNKEYTGGILEQEHLDALKRFWQYKENNPRSNNQDSNRVAYVLPKDYAYGFRGPNDKIWGLWEADDFSLEISKNLGAQLSWYQSMLDVVYDDGIVLNATYSKYIFWNNTVYVS